ncbi:hypothetical protein CCHR01_04406 [Colletotrichum chrysophilum]|uniref:Uncharacterized protein n=1 Tax=Colletotrichum chrysophilum TaxID=1836956 RepID=A0AAD9EQJ3_9PEZI|nr:hypothetical protein CCHR01_04406 [Colletotrichum chrysophilum]
MLLSLGSESLTLQKRSDCRRELLLLLERDLRDLSLFFCPRCVAVHPPELSWTIARDEEYQRIFGESRPCVRKYQRSRPDWDPSPWLPSGLDYETIRVAMTRYRLGGLCRPKDLLPMSQRWYGKFDKNGYSRPHVHHDTEFLVSRGRMILCTKIKLQTYKYVCSGTSSINIDKSLYLDILSKSADRSHCCAHMTWQRKYTFIFNPSTIETHESDNFQAKGRLSKRQKKVFGGIETCDFCHTSYTYCLRDGGGKIDLISYKDLGEGETTTDPRWRSHQWQGAEIPLQNINRHRLAIWGRWVWIRMRLRLEAELRKAKKKCFG